MKLRRTHKRVDVETISPYSLEGEIGNAIRFFVNLRDGHEGNFKDLQISYHSSHCYECEGTGEFVLTGTRPETDKELAARQRLHNSIVKANKAKRATQEATELATLQKLLAKYKEHANVAVQKAKR